MKVYTYEGKNIDDLKKKILSELNKEEEEIMIKTTEEEVGIFKTKKTKLEILIKDEVIDYIKELVNNITGKMGISVNIECKKRENFIRVNLFSDKNAILIGKGGKTIEALQTIIKYAILNHTGFHVNVILDVEDYKEKQNKHLEFLAKKVAREVASTGVEVKLDCMNSYERRIIHETLAENSDVYTTSEGEEPNRYVVVKPREKE